MKKLLFLFLLLILFVFLFNFYKPFNINIFNKFEKEKDTSIKKEFVLPNKKTKQTKKTSQQYFSMGEKDLENNNFKVAIINFSKAIELDPKYAEAYQKRAFAKDQIEDFTGSKEDYAQYMILHEQQNKEEYEEVKYELKTLVNQIKEKIKNKRYDEAITDSTNLINSYPAYPNGYIVRADTYFAMQKYKQSLGDYKKALSLYSENKNVNLYFKLANTEYMLKLYKDSISNYLQVVNLKPNYEYAYYKLIGAYIFVEDFNNALNILRKYKKISKTKKIHVTDYSNWAAIINKYTENETIRDLKKELKELTFIQA